MFAFFISVIGIVITGGSLVNESPLRDVFVYGTMGCLCISYFYFFCVRNRYLVLNSAEKSLFFFLFFALLHVLLSYLGVHQKFSDLKVYFDKSFIPRQAFYLLLLPAIILFQDGFYTKGKEYIIKHYGEIFFWCLFLISFLSLNNSLYVTTQLILCWLALRIKSPQRWRNWLRYAALIFAPLPKDGTFSLLILRFLFALFAVIPSGCKRVTLKWMTIALLIVIIAVSFIAPILITNTSFIPDRNTRWRMNYWIDEMKNLGNTYGLGVGYGTSYPSIDFAAVTKDFYAKGQYSKVQRTFVLASHNSFVSVAMRTGVFGVGAFLLFIILLLWEMLKYRFLPSSAAFFALFGAITCIAFNVGLESPNYLFSFIFCIGECNQEIHRIRKMSRVSESVVQDHGLSPILVEG